MHKVNKLVNSNDNNDFTKKIMHTNNITNKITRHSHNNYEHNVIKNNKHIKHVNNYDTEINYYKKKSFNKANYYNFYHGIFNFRKTEIISISQQTDITNNTVETNTQTTH